MEGRGGQRADRGRVEEVEGENPSMCLCESRMQSCSLAPGTTFLSAVASLSAKCTFDASPRMLL